MALMQVWGEMDSTHTICRQARVLRAHPAWCLHWGQTWLLPTVGTHKVPALRSTFVPLQHNREATHHGEVYGSLYKLPRGASTYNEWSRQQGYWFSVPRENGKASHSLRNHVTELQCRLSVTVWLIAQDFLFFVVALS